MKREILHIVLLFALVQGALGQSLYYNVRHFDEEDGLPSSHVSHLLQDSRGFMWFATWNGLVRFDGYDFHTFKSQPDDGCSLETDRLRAIVLMPGDQILCKEDNGYAMFDLRTYRFRDLSKGELAHAEADFGTYRQTKFIQNEKPLPPPSPKGEGAKRGGGSVEALGDVPLTFSLTDSQRNVWALGLDCIYLICTDTLRTQRLDITPSAEVKCLFRDNSNHYWVCTRDDQCVRVFTSDLKLLGYLGRDGQIHANYTRFGYAVYSMCQTSDGSLWLGTKPDGLFRVAYPRSRSIEHLTLPCNDIYDIKEDRWHRLWVATLGGGVFVSDDWQSAQPRFIAPVQYPKDYGRKARYLYIASDSILLVAATDGLLVSRLEADSRQMSFVRHGREQNRKGSLSSSGIMHICEDSHGRIYIGTDNGGVNIIDPARQSLLSTSLDFLHLNSVSNQLPSDIAQSVTMMDDDNLMITSGHLVILADSTGKVRVLDSRFFHDKYRFSEAHPLRIDDDVHDNTWLFGLTDGAFITTAGQMHRQTYIPKVVLTRVTVQGGNSNWAVEALDTLTLHPHERSVTIYFAALNYDAPERISYAWSLEEAITDEKEARRWNYIGHDRSATLLDMKPGTYLLHIRSTNADGEWTDQLRTLTIMVRPSFWESVWGRLLIVLLLLAVVATAVYTLLYIRRIKRKQHETLEKYLALLEDARNEPRGVKSKVQDAIETHELDDPMLKRVMDFIEANIGNSDASVGDMASAAATSRSGLQRKLKQAMGITPQDLLREARIKRACQLLRQDTDITVAEVAYRCGFTDPKYFSRCFKQSTGLSPTDYRNPNS